MCKRLFLHFRTGAPNHLSHSPLSTLGQFGRFHSSLCPPGSQSQENLDGSRKIPTGEWCEKVRKRTAKKGQKQKSQKVLKRAKKCKTVENNQEWPRQTKPKKGQLMNFSQGHSRTKVQCESCLFSQGKTPEFTKMGEIHELFVLALSLVWFARATPETSENWRKKKRKRLACFLLIVFGHLKHLPQSGGHPGFSYSRTCLALTSLFWEVQG